jgi:hypothetical protein
MNVVSSDKILSTWDCKKCPVASDLLKMLDELSARNRGLEFRNKRLRAQLAGRKSL